MERNGDLSGYFNACERAADDQGITGLIAELKARGLSAEWNQTGGFCMVADIDLSDGWNIYAVPESAGMQADGLIEDDIEIDCAYEQFQICWHEGGNAQAVADDVAEFVRRWHEGIAAYRATRRDAEDLNTALPSMAGAWPAKTAGWIYGDGDWIEKTADGRAHAIVATDEFIGTLNRAEAFLWALHGRHSR